MIRLLAQLLALAILWLPSSAVWAELIVSDQITQMRLQQSLPTAKEEGHVNDANFWRQSPLLLAQNYQAGLAPSSDVYWHKLDIKGQFSDPAKRTFYFSFDNLVLQYLDVYLFKDDRLLRHYALGRNQSPLRDGSDYKGIVLPLEIADGEQVTLMIRKHSNTAMIMPVTVYSEDAYQRHIANQYLFWGGVVALLLGIAAYNTITYILVKRAAYLWYLLFYGSSFLYFGGLHGFGYLLWGSQLQILLIEYEGFIHFSLTWMFLHFANSFLCSHQYAPKFKQFLKVFDLTLPIAALVSLYLNYAEVMMLFHVFQTAASAYCLLMCYTAYKNGFTPARLFAISWLVFLVCAGLCILAYINVIPATFLTLHAFFFGSLAELLILSVALADRLSFGEKSALLQAYTDPKTQLPNYSFFKNELPKIVEHYRQTDNKKIGLAVVKSHGIRDLIGLLGPQMIETAFASYTRQINEMLALSPWALPIPLGEDQSCHLLSITDDQMLFIFDASYDADSIVSNFVNLTEKPMRIGDIDEKLQVEVGVAVYHSHSSLEECYRQAQLALLDCERNQKAWCFYDRAQDSYIREKVEMLSELRTAIANEEITIFIQAQYCLKNQDMIGGEVLSRWIHPSKGMISPGLFIPLAETSNLIFDISRTVIEQSFRWLSQEKFLPFGFHLSINLSVKDIHHPDLIAYITQMVTKYAIKPEQVVFEVTESAVMDNPQKFVDVIAALRLMGFGIALDDFGTGYSSMSYLQDVDADIIKIDMSFIRDIQNSEVNRNIVKAIIQLASSSNAKTVAEGIEMREEFMVLQELGANYMQGYLLAKPLPLNEFSQQLLPKPGHNSNVVPLLGES